MCVFLIGTDVCLFNLSSPHIVVRSDQGGSRNLFADTKHEYENKPFNVTLVLDDNQFSADKCSNDQNYNEKGLQAKE